MKLPALRSAATGSATAALCPQEAFASAAEAPAAVGSQVASTVAVAPAAAGSSTAPGRQVRGCHASPSAATCTQAMWLWFLKGALLKERRFATGRNPGIAHLHTHVPGTWPYDVARNKLVPIQTPSAGAQQEHTVKLRRDCSNLARPALSGRRTLQVPCGQCYCRWETALGLLKLERHAPHTAARRGRRRRRTPAPAASTASTAAPPCSAPGESVSCLKPLRRRNLQISAMFSSAYKLACACDDSATPTPSLITGPAPLPGQAHLAVKGPSRRTTTVPRGVPSSRPTWNNHTSGQLLER